MQYVYFEKLSLALPSKDKWCKGSMYKAKQCCLLGAVKLVTTKLVPAVEDAIKKLFGDRMGHIGDYGYLISSFNDHPATTWDDVQAIIKEVERDT